jgi:hypothetical protein
MIVKLGTPLSGPLYRLPVRDELERRDPPLVERELRDRAEIDRLLRLLEEGRDDGEEDRRDGDEDADQRAEAERDAAQEA